MIKVNRVAIIIATFNAENTIQICLESCFNQNYKDLSIVIVDGASQDRTMEIISKFKNRLALVISEADSGIYEAWNKGLKNFRADWYCFIGSDDIWYSNDSVSLLMSRSSTIGCNLISSKIVPLNTSYDWNQPSIGSPLSADGLRFGLKTPHPGMMHHFSLFCSYGYFNESYKIAGDFEFLVRSRNGIKSIFLESPSIYMGQSGVSNTKHFLVRKETAAIIKKYFSYGFIYSMIYTIIFYLALSKKFLMLIILKCKK